MKYIIDRFEVEFAVCEDEAGSFINIKKDKLPDDAKEGDVILYQNNRYIIDYEETKKRKINIELLVKDLWID